MDWSQGALPMGMLFFAITILGFLRRKAGHVVARGQYPELAERLGLQYRPSRYATGVGSLAGTYRGFAVTVDPDDQRRIFMRFETDPKIELHSYAHNKRPQPGLQAFRPGDGRLARVFKTAHASPDNISALEQSAGVADRVVKLSTLRELKTLSVTSAGVTAVFDFGSPPFIPAKVVDEALPTLADLGHLFDRDKTD